MSIGIVYPKASTMHNVPIHDELTRMIVEEVRDESIEVPVPTSEVKVVGEALGTFIAWPTHLIKSISKNN